VALDVPRFKTAVLLVYGLPLAAFLGTLVLLGTAAPDLHDLLKAGAAFGALAVALVALKVLSARLGGGPQIEVVQVLSRAAGGPGVLAEESLADEAVSS